MTTLTTIPTPSAEGAAPAEAPAEPVTPAEPSTPEVAEPPAAKTEPDPDLEIARKLDSVAKREARARKYEATFQQKLAALEAREAEFAKKMADLEAALDDPVDYYIKKGKDPVEVAKRFAKPVTEEEKRIAKLEAKLAADEEARQKQAAEAEKRERQTAQERQWQSFVGEITREEYPHLTTVYQPAQIPGLVKGLLNRAQDPTDPESPSVRQHFNAVYGRDPTPKEIRDALEHEAETYAMSLIERLRPPAGAPSQDTPATPSANPGSTSLSNQHAASSSSGRPSNKSREEIMRELREQLEAETSA